ncbi:MAG: CTP synthase [Acidobacteria bacterium]|nr:CTP synthase [Acidobacteriota bacterium]MBI3487538.1 CTP synthase [Acidobacteriota bacterium]
MAGPIRLALVGDHDPDVPAHRAIPLALAEASQALGVACEPAWVGTDAIRKPEDLAGFHGLWCVPASPYRSEAGALAAIRWAREGGRPFLGTCGGFQHAVLEHARHVLGWAGAAHAEVAPGAAQAVIAPLACALVETEAEVRLHAGSLLRAIYGQDRVREGYRCRFGLNPAFAEALLVGPLRAAATDEAGEVRALERDGHPFFLATLFQPERAALRGEPVPLARALVAACAGRPSAQPFETVL